MLLTLAWGSLGVAILFGAALAVRRHDRAARLAKLRVEWGRTRDIDRDMKAIAAYYPGRAIAQPGSLDTTGWHILFPILGLTMVGAVALVPFWPAAVLVILAGAIVNLIARGTVARRLRIVAGAFRQVASLLAVAEVKKTSPAPYPRRRE